MIRFLQRQKAKKGFTIIELIVVIAVIAVMMAIIFPLFSVERSRKQEANSASRDFYAAMQSIMSMYSMYEGPLSPAYQDNPDYGEMRYYEKMGGNYPYKKGTTAGDIPGTASLYVTINTKNSRITDIWTYVADGSDTGYADGEGLYQLCKRKTENKNTEFGRLLKAEIEDRISYQDGWYYAKVTYKNVMSGTIPAKMEAETVKVEYTGFSRKPLPQGYSIFFTEYKNSFMTFGGQDNKLASGEIFGVCAPYNPTTGTTLGMAGTALN